MKIMIDAHNLGLKEPTGIGVYANNLASNLLEMGNEVYALYSMKYGSDKFPYDASFYQHLANHGETISSGILRWAYHGFPYFVSNILGAGMSPKLVEANMDMLLQGFSKKLPVGVKPLNLPYVYRVAQAYGAMTASNMQLSEPKKVKGLDVFHMTLPLPITLKSAKKVVTVHDLIPLKLPQSTDINLKHYWKIVSASLKDADMVFSVSEQTKKDLMEIFKFPEHKIHVTYQASYIPDYLTSLTEEDITPILKRLKLNYRQYFVFYGAIEPKKNVLRLLQAFSRANTDCKLVIIGKNGWLFEQEEKFFESQKSIQKDIRGYDQKIIRVPYAHFDEVMTLLKGARALLFPSLYEGFGLPVLEAMQMSTPVVTSRLGSLPEVAGEAAYYVDPYSVDDIRKAIEKLSSADDLLVQMSINGLKHSEKFSPENYRRKLTLGYQQLVR